MRKLVSISFALLFLIVASAGAAWAAGAFSTYDIPSDQSEAAANYWTPERMKNAIPMPTPQKPATVQGPVTGTLEQPTGASGSYPGYDPDRNANPTEDIPLNDLVGSTVSPIGASNGYDYPPPQETFFVMSSPLWISWCTLPLQDHREGLLHG